VDSNNLEVSRPNSLLCMVPMIVQCLLVLVRNLRMVVPLCMLHVVAGCGPVAKHTLVANLAGVREAHSYRPMVVHSRTLEAWFLLHTEVLSLSVPMSCW
jgi:hypothetical protein